MASSYLIEKLKFGEKYILASVVVIPLPSPKETDAVHDHEMLARNKYITRDIWQTFVYRKLYDLFRKHLAEDDDEKDRLFQLNREYRLHCAERPYLQMKYEFRDKTYRNTLNNMFKEKPTSLHENCIYVEISDQGHVVFNKLEDRDKTVLRLLKEISELKREATRLPEDMKTSPVHSRVNVAKYRPEPVQKSHKSTVEEYVPVTRSGISSVNKRTYKPSKIVECNNSPSEPDPYTPDAIGTPVKVSYVPTTSPHKNHPKTAKIDRRLFGSDDDEYDPSSVAIDKHAKQDSEQDMFTDSDRNSPGDSKDRMNLHDSEKTVFATKREVLPRNSKQNARALNVESPEEIEKKKCKTSRKNVPAKPEENLNALLRIKNGFRKKTMTKKDSTLGSIGKLEKLTEIATKMKRLSKAELFDCSGLSKEDLLDTFTTFKQELQDIFMRYKDQTERQWKSSSELCYFTELGNILDDDQKFTMLQHLEDEFVPPQERGKYTEFFTSSLLMEWGLRIFMDRHKFDSRQAALDCIKQQEKSYLASLSNDFLMKYH